MNHLLLKLIKTKSTIKLKQLIMIKDSEIIKDMEKNYRILRHVHGVLYTSVAENFQFYLNSLNQTEIEECRFYW